MDERSAGNEERIEQILKQADAATQAQDFDAAIALYRQLLAFDRGLQGAEAKLQWALRMQDIESLYQQGKAQLAAQRYSDALSALRKARLMYASHYKDTDQLIVEAQTAMQKENWRARTNATRRGCFWFGAVSALLVLLTACAPPTPDPAPTAIKMPTAGAAPAPQATSTATNTAGVEKIPPEKRNNLFPTAPKIMIDPTKQYIATIKTDKGDIVVELSAKDAPITVNNFVTLARAGFYNDLKFHRVEPGFVIQGGDPKGDGTGGPGYTIPAEIKLLHGKGAIAMARLGDAQNPRRDSSGSQFYLTLAATPHLDGAYTAFGQVTKGIEVVEKIARGDVIQTIVIEEK